MLEPLEEGGYLAPKAWVHFHLCWSLSSPPLLCLLVPAHSTLSQALSQIAQAFELCSFGF